MSLEEEIAEFNKERNEVFLSFDEHRIREFCKKWNNFDMPSDMEVFWGAVHKAITGNAQLPLGVRKQSKVWLDQRGLKSLDDDDL